MRKLMIAAAISAGALLTQLPSANAMPVTNGSAVADADITLVAQGCGPGFARGPYGRCRPMGGFGPRFGRPGFVRPGYGYGRPMMPRGRPYGYGYRGY